MQYTKLSIDINDQQKGIGMSFFFNHFGTGASINLSGYRAS